MSKSALGLDIELALINDSFTVDAFILIDDEFYLDLGFFLSSWLWFWLEIYIDSILAL
jgi:hypothetical protein